MSKLNLPIGISDFKKLRESNFYFVDKTLFIKDVVENSSEVLLFARPRRFGKTINLSMLYYFLTENHEDINHNLFKNTTIAEDKEFCEQYQNQAPVIFITFKDIKALNFQASFAKICDLMADLFLRFKGILEQSLSKDDLLEFNRIVEKNIEDPYQRLSAIQQSLKRLCRYIKQVTGKDPWILIDEYDTPITAAYVNNYYEEMVDLIRGLLGAAQKDNAYMKKAVVTGITKISQESIFSGANNPDVYSMLREDYGQYFGFTESEVIKLLNDNDHYDYFEKIKNWYNGYQIGEYKLYNPWSILNCVKQNYKFEPYWLNTSDNALIKNLITAAGVDIKTAFINLLQQNNTKQPIDENLVFPNVKTNDKSIWSLLHSSGYLNISAIENKGFRKIATLSIPNREVTYIYHDMIENWFTETLALSAYDRLVDTLSFGDVEGFKTSISNYLLSAGSYFDFSSNTPEQVFHSFMLGIVIGLKDDYVIESNKEAGYGRYDLVLIPKNSKNNGVVLEFKTANTKEELSPVAAEALSQIKDKKYMATFSQHKVKSVLLLGLAFCGKQVEVASEVINPH